MGTNGTKDDQHESTKDDGSSKLRGSSARGTPYCPMTETKLTLQAAADDEMWLILDCEGDWFLWRGKHTD